MPSDAVDFDHETINPKYSMNGFVEKAVLKEKQLFEIILLAHRKLECIITFF